MASLRSLATPDIPAWAALRFALWSDEASLETLQAELPAFLADDAQAGFGLFESSELVGFAEVSERTIADLCETSPAAWLEGIYLAPSHEGRGHARALLAACEDWARGRGLTEISSDARAENTRSLARHGQWGFAETRRVVLFRKVLWYRPSG